MTIMDSKQLKALTEMIKGLQKYGFTTERDLGFNEGLEAVVDGLDKIIPHPLDN